MAENINIYLRNSLGNSGSGKKNKLSASSTFSRNKDTVKKNTKITRAMSQTGKVMNIVNGYSSRPLTAVIGKMGTTGSVITASLVLSEKIADFGINIWEAETGESMLAHNMRAGVRTITSLGTNLLIGRIQNDIFATRQIARQNRTLDYGRELYNLNVLGEKYKRY